MSNQENDQKKFGEVSRRDFIKYTAGTAACISLGTLSYGCGTSTSSPQVAGYPIDATVVKTTERMISFPYTAPSGHPPSGTMPSPADPAQSPNGGTALTWDQLRQLQDYDRLGYGKWQYVNWPLPIVQRTDIMPTGYSAASVTKKTKLLNFFAMSDIHLTDKEAPNQFIDLQKSKPGYCGTNSAIYAGVMLYTPQLFDAAIQTANALHKKDPFDFMISLGDCCNTSMYNELRWYIDIIDGKVITPSSGAHLGADTIDYQKPFKAAGLDKSIPFYQAIGNHDHFMIGSFPVYENGLDGSYISDTVWSVSNNLLVPDPQNNPFPALFNINDIKNAPQYYQGVIDGSTPYGTVVYGGDVKNFSTPPKVAADPNRRSLRIADWIKEFFTTTTSPVGHGFNLVSSNKNIGLVPLNERAGFACYSFSPKGKEKYLKVIVLDDTQREDDGSLDIHGHGYLDAARWAWLKAELADGQAANQLMIIACHIPIAINNIGTELEWWLGDANTTKPNACTITELVAELQKAPNLLMWIAGHLHVNHIKAMPSPDSTKPEQGFWQVMCSSLRNFPQQFRTFEIYLNSDYTVSIEAVNVDIAVKEGTPAATSRKYAIATQQILHTNLKANSINYAELTPGSPLTTMDPTRPQGGIQGSPQAGDSNFTDPSIKFVDMTDKGVPYNASYNAQLFKKLSLAMENHLRTLYPAL